MMYPLIAIAGPTGVGKTGLSIALARTLKAEIISCDAMQFYRGMDIGTAKISNQEKAGVKHHLLDILNVNESFSVAEYQALVRQKIDALRPYKPVILVGGSGLYLKSILYDYQFLGPKRSPRSNAYDELPTEELSALLERQNPELYQHTDLSNRRRLLRALEKSDKDLDLSGQDKYYPEALCFVLEMPRKQLYERIDRRVDQMIEDGLVDEAQKIYKQSPSPTARQAIGYKELFRYFDGETDLATAIETIKLKTRHYAKKQFTWFRHQMDCIWITMDPKQPALALQKIIDHIEANKKDM